MQLLISFDSVARKPVTTHKPQGFSAFFPSKPPFISIFEASNLMSFSKKDLFPPPPPLAKQSLYLLAPRQEGVGALFDLGSAAASLFKIVLTEL